MSFQTRSLPYKQTHSLLCKAKPDVYPYALISTARSLESQNADYDIIFAFPQSTITLDHHFKLHDETGAISNKGFLEQLDNAWKQTRIDSDPDPDTDTNTNKKQRTDIPPFTGGWFVYLSYELAVEVEPALALPEADPDLPVAMAARCPAAVIVNHQQQSCYALAEDDYAHLLDEIEKDYRACCIHAGSSKKVDGDSANATTITASNIEEDVSKPYLDQVERIKHYIYDGDIFQANLSRKWQLTLAEDIDDIEIFEHLASSNPGNFAACVKFPSASIISSSPERLVSCRQGQVETRPIAGTRPRADKAHADTALAEELLAHPKEQAEHIMLIDLERNDLGRICIPGSIQVDELMTLESYQHVHHIVSNIQGKIRPQISPVDIIKAVFPGGTITGCPKVHCMEILAEMEQQARSAYTGSVGYINRDGSMDLNILIRTMIRVNNSISFRAGGGIVADSDARRELEETRAKARGLLNVFQVADNE